MIAFEDVYKTYAGQEALKAVSFAVGQGEMVLLAGHSGAGKSTLLRLLAAIERPTRGRIVLAGQAIERLKPRAIPYLRRNLGLIFQEQRLLHDRSVLENVLLPLVVTGTPLRDASRRARAALEKVGLLERERANPLALSGGEQQRVAIARAIVNRPALVLADEPTASLDQEAAQRIVDVLHQFNQVGVTVLIATHDEALLGSLPHRVVRLDHGRVAQDQKVASP